MCWYVYIATEKPLEDVLFTNECGDGPPPLLHFQEVIDDPNTYDSKVRHLFKAPHVYYVGSSSGCSCHLDGYTLTTWAEGEERQWEHSCAVFLDFLQRYTKRSALDMYAVWENDWSEGVGDQPAEYVTLDASTLTMQTYFGLTSRRFYTFVRWKKD